MENNAGFRLLDDEIDWTLFEVEIGSATSSSNPPGIIRVVINDRTIDIEVDLKAWPYWPFYFPRGLSVVLSRSVGVIQMGAVMRSAKVIAKAMDAGIQSMEV